MPKVTFANLKQSPPQGEQVSLNIKEWGDGTFLLKQLSGVAYESMVARLKEKLGDNWSQEGGARLLAIILASCLVDEDGTAPDEEWLMTQSISLLKKLGEEASKLNGMSVNSAAALEKN